MQLTQHQVFLITNNCDLFQGNYILTNPNRRVNFADHFFAL